MKKTKVSKIYILGVFAAIVLILFNFAAGIVNKDFPYYLAALVPLSSIILAVLFGFMLVSHEKMLRKTNEEQAEEAKYQFLTVATHKFRTPLTSIKWLLGNLKKELTHEQKMDAVKQMEVAVDRIGEVVDALTGMTKFNSKLEYAFEVAWMREMVDVALNKYSPLFREKAITFNISTDHDIPLVIMDKRKMQFVVDTLIENAIRYSPNGGNIDISLYRDGDYVVLGVRDNGIGIDKKDLPRIFERFYRSKEAVTADPEGMGLSLAMINDIVKNHDGEILVESEGLGKGSTFFIKLKISDQKPEFDIKKQI